MPGNDCAEEGGGGRGGRGYPYFHIIFFYVHSAADFDIGSGISDDPHTHCDTQINKKIDIFLQIGKTNVSFDLSFI